VTPPRKKTSDQASTRLPPDLAGPVDVELTHSVDVIPTAFKPGTLAIEPKWDGYRAVVIRTGGTARIWSRQRNNLTDGFRDIAAAAVSQVPDGVVLDGELVGAPAYRSPPPRMSPTPGTSSTALPTS
jgi:ATP-dependent DNA ligase